jgi:hypothetical protein
MKAESEVLAIESENYLEAVEQTEIDFVANHPGLRLFHCHQPTAYGLRVHDLFDYF